MLPIEAAFESISEYWKSLHPDLPSPAVQIAGKEVVEAEVSIIILHRLYKPYIRAIDFSRQVDYLRPSYPRWRRSERRSFKYKISTRLGTFEGQ